MTVVHERYTKPIMQQLWSPEFVFDFWLKVELAFLRARMEAGDLSREAYEAIDRHASFETERIHELDKQLDHDLIAFVKTVQESLHKAGVGQYASEIHHRLTSYDTEDPAMVLMLRAAANYILEVNERAEGAFRRLAAQHKWTFLIAHTHGQYAEPSTLGHLLLVFAEELRRTRRRLLYVIENELCEAKMSGAVGNFPGLDPSLEVRALDVLSLKPAVAETQIVQRDRVAMFLSVLAICASSIEQIGRTFWEMMRSNARELEEPRRSSASRGSSRMAYKRNPRLMEQLQGLARLVRADALCAMENIATPEFRGIEQSCVERHILPRATTLVHYMLETVAQVGDGLIVHPERMLRNLDEMQGVWASNPIRDALLEAQVPYDDAYLYTQRLGFKAIDEGLSLVELLETELISEAIQRPAKDVLGEERLRGFFDHRAYVERGINEMFSRAGL